MTEHTELIIAWVSCGIAVGFAINRWLQMDDWREWANYQTSELKKLQDKYHELEVKLD